MTEPVGEADVSARQALARGVWPWKYPALLAPMEGVTHAGYRTLIASYGGVGVVCTEFVRITRAPLSRRQLQRQVEPAPGAALSVQVMGNDEANMAQATEWVVDAGTDIVDINLGCPAPNAVRKGVGAAMLERPEVLSRVVRAMRERTPGPLSAKMRAGVAAAHGAVATAQLLESVGVDFITVHPRCSIDGYRGNANHDLIALIKRSVRVPVVGNGDLWFAGHALRLLEQSGCDAVMMGRPAMRNPWIFRQLADLREGREPYRPDGPALLDHVENYLLSTEVRADRVLLGPLKEQLRYLLRPLADAPALIRQVLRDPDVKTIMHRLQGRLAEVTAEALDLGSEPRVGCEERPHSPRPEPVTRCLSDAEAEAVPLASVSARL